MLSWKERLQKSKEAWEQSRPERARVKAEFQQLRAELKQSWNTFKKEMRHAWDSAKIVPIDSTYQKNFDRLAEQASVPEELREAFCLELFNARNSPQDGQRVAEKYFAMWDFSWPEGTELLKADGKRGTYKQHCRLFAQKIAQKTQKANNLTRKRNVNSSVFPYLRLCLGPSRKPCPLHSQFEGLLLEQNHDFWNHFEMTQGGHEHCKCSVQIVTKRQYEEYLKNGIPSRGKPILNDNGTPTGHFEKKTVPAITSI